MLKTRLTGEVIPDFDNKIIEWINNNKFEKTGQNWVIGIDNKNNKVYRIIEVTGFDDFDNVSELLSSMNLSDLSLVPYARTRGYDARFRSPELMDIGDFGHILVTRI